MDTIDTENTDKNKTEVIVLTGHYRINGDIFLFEGDRLTDYIRMAESFIVIVNAEVMDRSGNVILTTPFLNIYRDKIEAIMPADKAVKI